MKNISQEKTAFFRDVWSRLTVPVRPGPEGLDLYREQIDLFTRKQVLVLGATPELVDMALRLGADRVVSIERNPEIMAAMRQLGEEDWSSVQMVVGDWLEHRSEFHAAFNCIVCDGGLLFLEFPGQVGAPFRIGPRISGPRRSLRRQRVGRTCGRQRLRSCEAGPDPNLRTAAPRDE